MKNIVFEFIERYFKLDEDYSEKELVDAYNDCVDLYEFDEDLSSIEIKFYQNINENIFNGLDKWS